MHKEVDVMEEANVVKVVSKGKQKSTKKLPKPKVTTKLKKGGK